MRRRPAGGVETHARSGRHDPHAGIEIEPLFAGPLAQCHVGHLESVGSQPLGEIAIPTLRATHGIRVKAVVDDADTHRPQHRKKDP